MTHSPTPALLLRTVATCTRTQLPCKVICTSHAGLGPPLHPRSLCRCELPGCRDLFDAFRGVLGSGCMPGASEALTGFMRACSSSCGGGEEGLADGCADAIETLVEDEVT